VDNIIFLKRRQWVATNYILLVYAAIFVISAQYFSRTDFARNSLGVVAIVAFFIHWYMMFLFQSAIEKFRARLYWIYRTYFHGEEQAGLDLPHWTQNDSGLTASRELFLRLEHQELPWA
jgi:amino acid permease